MRHLLSEIVANKRKEVQDLPANLSASKIRKRSFVDAIADYGIIAEIKPKSPSQGALLSPKALDKYIAAYDTAAQAISVLCDKQYFGGGYELVQYVRKTTDKPILAKEFIVDKRQIVMAKKSGADAVLLIASILSEKELITLLRFAVSYGLDVLLEVHNKDDCDKVISIYAHISTLIKNHVVIGINNRDLDSLKIYLGTTARLVKYLREHLSDVKAYITESGIEKPEDTKKLSKHVTGFLIGTSILKSKKPVDYILSLRPKKVKFCGITRKEDIQIAEKLGVDYLGFIFAKSPRHLTLNQAQKLRKHVKNAKVVGVFDDQSADEINVFIKELKLDFVQLHGNPSLQILKKLHAPVIQAFRGMPNENTARKYLHSADFILIDKAQKNEKADYKKIADLPSDLRSKLFVAGGVEPKNVQYIVKSIQPYAVDCASGIELKRQPGKKSSARMSSFIHKVKS